jgi:hypothetical protein
MRKRRFMPSSRSQSRQLASALQDRSSERQQQPQSPPLPLLPQALAASANPQMTRPMHLHAASQPPSMLQPLPLLPPLLAQPQLRRRRTLLLLQTQVRQVPITLPLQKLPS